MDGARRIIYVPLENRVREFDARLLLALRAASANFQVLLGPKWMHSLNAEGYPRGIFITKTLNKIDAADLRRAGGAGHALVAWDEEGPGQIVPEIYLKGIDDEAMGLVGRIYAWGGHQARALGRKYPAAKANIQTLGNPRWDLLRPEYRGYFAPEAAAIRARFGRFILINTNFSSYNAWHPDGAKEIATLADETGAFKKDDEADQQVLSDIIEFEKQTFHHYAEMLPALSAAFPDHSIVVRPHPTENHERWHALTAPYPNVKTVYEGTVIPWLLAAEAVIQNSCTTGVEALTLGRPVISYCKTDSPLQEWHLANQVCYRVHDEASLIESLKKFIANPPMFGEANAAGRRTLAKHISCLAGETSTEAIVKSLISYANKYEKQATKLARTMTMAEGFKPYPVNKYRRLKLPIISAADVQERVIRITKLHPDIATVTISHIAESAFYFRR
ncbi:MAG: surface carbohydrate biosynthesis protein [Rhodospirillaceae bacterium]